MTSAVDALYLKFDGPIPQHEMEAALKADGRWIRPAPEPMTVAEKIGRARGQAILAWSDMRRLCKRHDRFNPGLIQAHRMHTRDGSVYGRRQWMELRKELRGLLTTYQAAMEQVAVLKAQREALAMAAE